MNLDETMSTILGCSISGYYKWEKDPKRIIRDR